MIAVVTSISTEYTNYYSVFFQRKLSSYQKTSAVVASRSEGLGPRLVVTGTKEYTAGLYIWGRVEIG
jgi:hypothetical protein